MIQQNLKWVPFFMLIHREIQRFVKVIVQTLVTPFVSSFLYLLVFGVSLGGQMTVQGGHSYLTFLIPGLVMMGLMNNAYQNSSSSIISSKFSGDLEDLKIAPMGEKQILWALSLAALARGAIVGAITFLCGFVFQFFKTGEILTIAHPFWLIYFVIMGGLVFGMLGLSIAFWSKSFEQTSAFSTFILLPLTYLGGVFISIQDLHPFWQFLSKLNPLLYFINGVRYGIIGASDISVLVAAGVSLVGLMLFYAIALFSIRKGSFARW